MHRPLSPLAPALLCALAAALAAVDRGARDSALPMAEARAVAAVDPVGPLFRLAPPAAGLDDPGAPHGVAVAPDGTVYASDARDRRVLVVGPDGTMRDVWAAADRFAFGPWEANGVAVAPDGAVLVAVPGARVVLRLSPGGALQRAFGPDGTAGSRFVRPAGVATGPDGTVVVVDQVSFADGRVYAFAPDGAPRPGWGQALPAAFQLRGAHQPVVAPDGTVLVAGGTTGKIVVFGPDGAPTAAWGAPGDGEGQLRRPTGIALEPGDTVLVADLERADVQRFALDGTFVARLAGMPELTRPVGLARAADGAVVVADATGRLVWLAPDGTPVRTLAASPGAAAPAGLGDLVDVVADPRGGWVVLDAGGRLARFDALGRLASAWPTVRPVSVNGGLAVGPAGDVWVADDGIEGKRVQHYAPDGAFTGDVGPDGAAPGAFGALGDIAAGPEGDLVVADAAAHRLVSFGPDGRPAARWGRFGRRLPGGLAGPRGVDVAADRVAVVDDDGKRVQIVDRGGAAVAAWGGRGWEACGVAPTPADVTEIAFAPDGTLWGARQYGGQLTRFGPDGAVLATAGVDPLGGVIAPRLSGLAVDGAGRVAVGQRFSGVLQVFGPPPAAWRAEWYGNRSLVGTPMTVTHPAAIDVGPGGGWPPEAADGRASSVRFVRTVDVAEGRWRLTARGAGGVRAVVADRLLFDHWGEAEVDAAGEAWLPAGPWPVVVEHQAPPGGVDAGRLVVTLARVSDATLTPTASMMPTPAWTPTMTPSPTPTRTPTPTATPWATPLPHRLYVPRAANGVAAPPATPPPPHLGRGAIDVEHYAIDARLADLAAADVRLVVTATVRLVEPAAGIALDAEPTTIRLRAAAVDGRPSGWGWAPGEWNPHGISGSRLHVPLGRVAPAGGIVEVALRYDVAREALLARDAQRAGLGLTLGTARPYEGRLLSRNSPYYARRWLPSHDAPSDAATVTFTLRVPEGQVAAANGALVGGTYKLGDGRDAEGLRVFRFDQDDPIPPYLIAVAAGPYAVRTAAVCFDDPPAGAPVDPDEAVRLAVTCDGADHRVPLVGYDVDPDGPTAREAAAALAYWSRHIAPWPYPKLGLIEGPHPYAMEYPGLIANAGASAAHEVAHAWFGNTVQLPHWGDFWWKEGLAEFMGAFPSGDFEDAKLCDCPTAPLAQPAAFDPMAILSLPVQFGGGAVYCQSHGAIFDLHRRTAEAAGLTIRDRPARVLMLAVLRDLHAAFAGRTMSSAELVEHLSVRLPDAYDAAGLALDGGAARALVAAWALRWVRAGAR